jgi:hypothetical protein
VKDGSRIAQDAVIQGFVNQVGLNLASRPFASALLRIQR